MSILWFQRYVAIALVALTGFVFSLGPTIHTAHAMNASGGHESHVSFSHGVWSDCDTCSDQSDADCLRHCLEQSDASYAFQAQTDCAKGLLATSSRTASPFEGEELIPARGKHKSRGSPSVILKTQKLE